jgi:hypothetical protein
VGTNGRLSEDLVPNVAEAIATGHHDGHVGLMESHWHTADELEAEVRAAGFDGVTVFGVEGPAWPTLDAMDDDREIGARDAAIRCARMVERDPLLIHASAHLIAIGRT